MSTPWWTPQSHADRRPLLLARNRIQAGIRSWLAAEGFLEVDTAALQVSPGNEAHLHGFATTAIGNDGAARAMYLHTSPEFAMKKLLAAGETRIAAFAHVWRNRERGALHSPEFTMLEWYRVGEDYCVLMQDTVEFLRLAAETAGSAELRFRDRFCDPFAPPERLSVAEAFQRYAHAIPGFHVLPIYGGQGYGTQLSALRRGLHVIVGTPGRIIDHLDKGSLDLSALRTLVLDEADEMLRMGFVEEVERILSATPEGRQTALFSATMPAEIRRIARTHLREPAEITIAAKTATATNIRQRQWLVSGMHKLDALTRILEVESFEAMIVFTRTKLGTEELAEKLQARGFPAAAINGDMVQQQRERTIALLREGEINILVATDVAARGLDVERISHVFNYGLPMKAEDYTHRIGRTGRAGRSGQAITFAEFRDKRKIFDIEAFTHQPFQAQVIAGLEPTQPLYRDKPRGAARGHKPGGGGKHGGRHEGKHEGRHDGRHDGKRAGYASPRAEYEPRGPRPVGVKASSHKTSRPRSNKAR